jgi:hypothetical protein
MKVLRYIIMCAAVSCASVAYADIFSTPAGATAGGQPVNATAIISTSDSGAAFVTIINNQANPTSIIQAVSDLFFDLNGPVGSGSLNTSQGVERNIAANGTFTDGNTVDTGWDVSHSGSTFHLNVLGTPIGPAHLIIGGPDINSNVYSNANGSIAGNGPHNPFLAGPAFFMIEDFGIFGATQVSNVIFSFGTEAGTNVPGVGNNVPDSGATVALLGLALMGLAAARAKFRKA